MKKVYPVVFKLLNDEKDTVLAEIPDLKSKAQGYGMADAIENARYVIGIMGISLEVLGKEIAEPWSVKEFSLEDFPGNSEAETFVSMVDIDFSEFRKELEGTSNQSGLQQPWYVKESAVAYDVKKEKGQGDYTLEDYYNFPEEQRVELIDGVIYDMSAPTLVHQAIAGKVYFLVSEYIKKKDGKCIPFMSPVDVCLDCDDRTMVQPDLIILCDKNKLKRWGIMGVPEFVLEVISESSRKKDYTKKLQKYTDAGVKEYWIIDPKKKSLVVYDFINGDYPTNYLLTGKVGLALYNGELEIDLNEIAELIQDWPE